MSRGEVLVAIMNDRDDFEIAQEKGWYRIPVSSQKRWLQDRWPPDLLAFYQTQKFRAEGEAHAVNYCAQVRRISEVSRRMLFPDMPRNHPKANHRYYQVFISSLTRLPHPILSRRLRRVVFIPTTRQKLFSAVEINDLWDESPLEDQLWAILKQTEIRAERQYDVEVDDRNYFLDFAIFCKQGKIAVETDGDTWHVDPERAPLDYQRDNDLKTKGWEVLRFGSREVKEATAEYCVSTIMRVMNNLGGPDEGVGVPVRFNPADPLGPQQLGLFD